MCPSILLKVLKLLSIPLRDRNARRPPILLRKKCLRLAFAIIWDDYENYFSVQIPELEHGEEQKKKQSTVFIRFAFTAVSRFLSLNVTSTCIWLTWLNLILCQQFSNNRLLKFLYLHFGSSCGRMGRCSRIVVRRDNDLKCLRCKWIYHLTVNGG